MQSNYTVRVIHYSDVLGIQEMQEMIQFCKTYFVRDEPLAAAMRVDGLEIDRDAYWTEKLRNGLSIVALDDHGKVIGISLNDLSYREDQHEEYEEEEGEEDEEEERVREPPRKGIDQLYKHLRRESWVWSKVSSGCYTLYDICKIAVRDDWRGNGVMKALCTEFEKMAEGAVRMTTTSIFSAEAAEKLGFTEIYRLPYKNQNYILPPDPPHLDIRVYIKNLYS